MTEQEYTESNELISDFLKLSCYDGSHISPIVGGGFTKMLEYHYNRNWLHKAWQQFRDLRFENVAHQIEHSVLKDTIVHCLCYMNVDSAFQSIVSAIKWYNSINKDYHEMV